MQRAKDKVVEHLKRQFVLSNQVSAERIRELREQVLKLQRENYVLRQQLNDWERAGLKVQTLTRPSPWPWVALFTTVILYLLTKI